MQPVSCAGCQALQRRLHDLKAENERLRRQLDEATRATLRIYPERFEPEEVTKRLGIEPSSWQRRGEPWKSAVTPNRVYPLHGWFLTTRGALPSRDARKHLDWLLERLVPRADAVQSLQADGCRMDICCYWASRSGHGGPTLSPGQMGELARLGLELWFDVYFVGEDQG
jgi:hypothetical protein